jgi:hypothetical protein
MPVVYCYIKALHQFNAAAFGVMVKIKKFSRFLKGIYA